MSHDLKMLGVDLGLPPTPTTSGLADKELAG